MKPNFRAWDKKANGYMHDLLESDYSEEGYDHPYDVDEWCTKQGHFLANFNKFSDRLIWEQDTGLVDKNGVSIFEGDIVVYGLEKKKYVIEWDNVKCRFFAEYIKEEDRDIYTGYRINPRLKVIGNIHEQKDKE